MQCGRGLTHSDLSICSLWLFHSFCATLWAKPTGLGWREAIFDLKPLFCCFSCTWFLLIYEFIWVIWHHMTIQTRHTLTSLAHQSSPGMVGMKVFSWAPLASLASASCLITSKVRKSWFFLGTLPGILWILGGLRWLNRCGGCGSDWMKLWVTQQTSLQIEAHLCDLAMKAGLRQLSRVWKAPRTCVHHQTHPVTSFTAIYSRKPSRDHGFMMFHDISCLILHHTRFQALRMLPAATSSDAFKIRWGYNSEMSSGRSTCTPHSTKPRAWNVPRRYGSVTWWESSKVTT